MIRMSLIGIFSGILLGVILVFLSSITGYPLDVVLLDLSYIPILSLYNTLPIQWLLHLIVAVVAAIAYRRIYLRILPANLGTGALFGLLTSLVYFVLQPLAAPELGGQIEPLALWFAAHAIYGIILHMLNIYYRV